MAATAVFQLVARARATARPADAKVKGILARHERTEITLGATRLPVPDPSILDALKARSKAARLRAEAISAEFDVANARLAGLQVDQRRRRGSLWSRLLGRSADLSAAMEDAHRRRDQISARQGVASDACRRAEATERAARRAAFVAEAGAQERAEANRRIAKSKLAAIGRARRLLARVPILAYIGASRLLALATRIEAARDRGYDPGPSLPQR